MFNVARVNLPCVFQMENEEFSYERVGGRFGVWVSIRIDVWFDCVSKNICRRAML